MALQQGFGTPRHLQITVLKPEQVHVSDEVLELAKKTSSATISGILARMGFRFVYMTGVKPIKEGLVMAGRAYTLRYLPKREDHSQMGSGRPNYAQHVAIESIGPGEVLVVDTRGNTRAGIFGDMLVARMKYRGAVGLVTDGALRDTPYIKSIGYPVFAQGTHGYAHSAEHWAMDTQLPIACGDVTVYPSDLVVGDDDGVVVCPQAIAEEVVNQAIAEEAHEEFSRELIEKGASINDVHPLSEEMEKQYEVWRKNRKA